MNKLYLTSLLIIIVPVFTNTSQTTEKTRSWSFPIATTVSNLFKKKVPQNTIPDDYEHIEHDSSKEKEISQTNSSTSPMIVTTTSHTTNLIPKNNSSTILNNLSKKELNSSHVDISATPTTTSISTDLVPTATSDKNSLPSRIPKKNISKIEQPSILLFSQFRRIKKENQIEKEQPQEEEILSTTALHIERDSSDSSVNQDITDLQTSLCAMISQCCGCLQSKPNYDNNKKKSTSN